jgi:signal transduction histidine kinase
MGTRRIQPVHGYVLLVSLFGQGVFVSLLRAGDFHGLISAKYLVFAGLLLVGELFPIKVPRKGEEDEITTSTTFAYAILLSQGLVGAVLAQVIASVTSDLIRRKPVWKALFNASQYTLALAGCSAVLHGLTNFPASSGIHSIVPGQLPAILAAGAVFCLLNIVLTALALALAQGVPIVDYVGRDISFQALTDGILMALSPVVLVAADWSLVTLPLVALPLVAVYRSARTSVENTRLVAGLERSLAELSELNRLKDDFVSSVSHELRTPLTVMQGFVKTLLRTDATFSEAERRSFLEAVDRSSGRLRHLIERLLVMARLESDHPSLELAPFSLRDVTRNVTQTIAEFAGDHRVDLFIEDDITVESDPTMVQQILLNLVENGVKYSPLGSRVSIRVRRDGEAAVISVEDEGFGVPPIYQERIFERFYRVGSTSKAVAGAGLGLYIARRLSEEIGGSVALDRSDERGSVFSLRLPPLPAVPLILEEYPLAAPTSSISVPEA